MIQPVSPEKSQDFRSWLDQYIWVAFQDLVKARAEENNGEWSPDRPDMLLVVKAEEKSRG